MKRIFSIFIILALASTLTAQTKRTTQTKKTTTTTTRKKTSSKSSSQSKKKTSTSKKRLPNTATRPSRDCSPSARRYRKT